MVKGSVLHIGHSPDPDDAFMFFGIATGAVSLPGWEVRHVLADIETLNEWAFRGTLEVTAISAAVYPWVAETYRLLRVGASVGRRYGPKLLARTPSSPDDLRGRRIAVPGRYTTAFLLLRLYLPDCRPVPMAFDRIPTAVARGEVDAGLVIHEAQLTYPAWGLYEIADLGRWWAETTGLPIPLGVSRKGRGAVRGNLRPGFQRVAWGIPGREVSMRSYQELEVWKSAMDLVLQVYHLTEPLPPTETYGLRAQMRRAALSIPSNIAEGWGSGARRRYVHMLKVARGSLMELETQGILAARLGYISPEALEDLLETTRHITRMLNRLIHVLARP